MHDVPLRCTLTCNRCMSLSACSASRTHSDKLGWHSHNHDRVNMTLVAAAQQIGLICSESVTLTSCVILCSEP